MEWEPAARVAVVNVAMPLEFRVAVPREAVPSRKVTVPVGAGAALGARWTAESRIWDTFAVKVRLVPATTELALASRVVVVARSAWATVTETVAEVLAVSLASPW
jgi:hypothetical protein